MGAAPRDPCERCGAPLDAAQSYCLGCGARLGSRSPMLVDLLARMREQDARTGEAPPPARARAAGVALPPAGICALLVAVFVGFGVVLGGAASSPVNATLASACHVKLIMPPSAGGGGAGSAGAAPEEPSREAPASEESSVEGAGEAPASATPSYAAPRPSQSPVAPSASSEGEGEGGASAPAPSAPKKLPPVRHVFVIMLSNQPYAETFGPSSPAPYLSRTLEKRGALLVRYDAVAHERLPNELAVISGQGPTAQTAEDCPLYADIAPAGRGPHEQVLGSGCVYPSSTQTLAGQLTARHLTWRAYVQGLGEGPAAAACVHPASRTADAGAAPGSAPGYSTYTNPFVYFHAVTDSPACAASDVGLSRLAADLAGARAPSFSYIAPDRCHDGNPVPCAPGAAAGLPAADTFLRSVVPKILASKAYAKDGLLVITTDEAPSSGEFADSSSCCGQPRFPNLAPPPGGLSPRGGGSVGALLLSPFIKGRTTNQEPFNHFSLLRTIEDLFGVGHLGYAALAQVKPFEPAIFSAYSPR